MVFKLAMRNRGVVTLQDIMEKHALALILGD
jgi:hypothetical protein